MYYKQDCKYQILRIQFRPYNRKFEISAVKPVGRGGKISAGFFSKHIGGFSFHCEKSDGY